MGQRRRPEKSGIVAMMNTARWTAISPTHRRHTDAYETLWPCRLTSGRERYGTWCRVVSTWPMTYTMHCNHTFVERHQTSLISAQTSSTHGSEKHCYVLTLRLQDESHSCDWIAGFSNDGDKDQLGPVDHHVVMLLTSTEHSLVLA